MNEPQYILEAMRYRRMIADRNDFITKKGLWKEFCDFRPNDEEKKPRRDIVDLIKGVFKL
jgi:hypothetical protein